MDRNILESNPHQVIEGLIISAYAIGAMGYFIFGRISRRLSEQLEPHLNSPGKRVSGKIHTGQRF